MGTTLICLKVHEGKIHIVNSGDSRGYILRAHSLLRLTEDHSKVEEMVQAGRAEADDEKLIPWRRYVKGGLGFCKEIDPDVIAAIPQRGDIYLLCSDGLSKMLNDEQIKDIVVKVEKNIEKSCFALIQEANRLGGRDNVTVLMLEVLSVDSSIFDFSSQDKTRDSEAQEETFQ